MAHDAPQAAERTNPLLWFGGLVVIIAIVGLWFSHWFDTGVAHGRGETIEIPSTKAAEPIDFAKLIADRSDAVLERGATVYSKNCVSCHGPTGQENPTGLQPPPRNYHKDEFKNPNGGGPYGLYTVLENGFNGRMPAQPGLSSADKFAVIHFIRETWVKKDNAANYIANDLPPVAARIPKPGEGAEKGPEVPPPQRPVTQPVQPLLAATAADAAADAAAADDWLVAAAQPQSAARLAPLVAKLADHRGSGAVTTLFRAARAGDDAQIRALLERGDSPLYLPALAVSAGEATDLVKYLTSKAAAKPSSTGAK